MSICNKIYNIYGQGTYCKQKDNYYVVKPAYLKHKLPIIDGFIPHTSVNSSYIYYLKPNTDTYYEQILALKLNELLNIEKQVLSKYQEINEHLQQYMQFKQGAYNDT